MIALISDVHGNYEALKKVLEKTDNMGISEVYCLGDVAGYYSQINECCDVLRERNVKCVMGNHDWYLVSGVKCERSRSVNDCLKFQQKKITRQNLNWIAGFPVIMHVDDLSFVHGGWENPIDEYAKVNGRYFENIRGKYFASGHSHIACVKVYGDKLYCNPGSVGQPRDGDNRASFATFDGETFVLYRVEYDIQRVGKLMDQAGFDPYYYGCLKDASAHLHA